MQFELPIIYTNEGVAPRKRKKDKYLVADKAVFDFPVADISEMEPALTFRVTVDKGEGRDEGAYDTVFHQIAGHLVREVPASSRIADQDDLSLTRLGGLSEAHPRDVPEKLRVPSTSYHYGSGYSQEIFPVSSLLPKHVETSGFEGAVSELQAAINESLAIVGDTVYYRVHDPKINIWLGNGDYSVDPSLVGKGLLSFPPDRPDLVEEFTGWLEREHGVRRKPDDDNWGRNRKFILDNQSIPLSSNPVIEAALALADRACLNIVNADYYGAETKRLGLELLERRDIESAFSFVEAFEAAAALPGAEKVGHYGENATLLFSCFHKFVELMPDEYKGVYSQTIDIPFSRPITPAR